MIRRSITIDDDLNTWLNKLRARLLEHDGIEMDFTSAINMVAMMGAHRMSHGLEKLDRDEVDIMNEYVHGIPELQLESAQDKYTDLWLEHELPKLTREKSQEPVSKDSTKRKKESDDQSE